MFKRKKKKTGCETPEFRSKVPMPPVKPPPPPTSGSNAVKPNPSYVPPASIKKSCPYETPCGWCTKWDKKCDNKIGPERGQRVNINPIDDAIDEPLETLVNKACTSESDHEWVCDGMSTEGGSYTCTKCYVHKFVPHTTELHTHPTITAFYDGLTVTLPIGDPDHMWNNNNEYDYKINKENENE